MTNEFSLEQLEFMKKTENLYLKLVYLIKFTCLKQNDITLMCRIYKNVNKINNLEEKCIYLLETFLENSISSRLVTLKYIGVSIELTQSVMEITQIFDAIKGVDKIEVVDGIEEKKANIDYNLRHLKRKENQVKILNRNFKKYIKRKK